MADFLLELLSEEIPARMQDRARADLARLFADELGKAGLEAQAIETYATPRRLALIARDLPAETAAVSEELKGPRTSAPPQALEGFLRKTGLTQEQLVERDGVWFAVIDRPGRATASVLAEAVPAVVRAFPWPKSMRWGAASLSTESLRWVRPLQGIVALLAGEVVPFEIDGIASGAETVGHRFHHPGRITIGSAADYAPKLHACHVIVDQDERRRLIAEGARAAASAAGLTLVEDEGLLIENAGLTEWPVPLLGSFDPAFLEVPREVIQLTMRTNQKYFACVDRDGRLAPNFVCVANLEARDRGQTIVAGNQKVLAARLSDAKFFWEQDLKVRLEDRLTKLREIVFHEKLGTVYDKVERIEKLALWLVDQKIIRPAEVGTGAETQLYNSVKAAARLAKADLVTGMVGEFPELQGVMGGYYARAEGLPGDVADAIRDHYGTPIAPVSVAVSLADKIDTIREFFGIDEKPTGSKDPFALRRAAIQSLTMIMRGLRLDLGRLVSADVIEFFIERWMAQSRAAGGRPDFIAAVRAATRDGDLHRLGERMRALEAFLQTPEGANLLAGYKRAANILKKENWTQGADVMAGPEDDGIPQTGEEDPLVLVDDPQLAGVVAAFPHGLRYDPAPEEAALIAALDAAEPQAAAAIEREDFEGAMAALASLRAPVDAFFDRVTVNDPDPAKREARLNLLLRIRSAVHRVADFSKVEG
jgi:glycyl-tRNA synthetase beta chain